MKTNEYVLESEYWITNEERHKLLENLDSEKVTDFAVDNGLDFDGALLVMSGKNTLEEVKERTKRESDAFRALYEKLESEGCSEVITESLEGVYKITATPVSKDYLTEAHNECMNIR